MARAPKISVDDRVESSPEAVAPLPFFDDSVARMMSWPVEAWLRCQAGMLKAVEPATAGWLERRRAAATATLDTLERLAGCRDLHEAAAIQRGWIEESIKRFDTDLHALTDQALALSQEAMSATRYATETSAEVVGLAVQPAAIQPVQRAAEQAAQQTVDAAA